MNYNITELPYVYMFSAVASVIVGYFYTQLEEKIDVQKLLKVTLFFILVIVSSFFIALKMSTSKEVYMVLMSFKDLIWIFVGMEFGILTGMIFNIRQGKRLFGILMSGEILSGIIAGISIEYILNYIETTSLLLISIISLVLSFLLLVNILSRFSDSFVEEADEEESDNNEGYSALFKNPYYLLFFAISIFSFFVFYFIEYLFYFEVEEHFKDEKALAGFFGLYFAALNILNLFSSLFLLRTLLSRFGVSLGLLIIPVLAFVGISSLTLLSLTLFSFGFFILVGIKILNEVFDISILTPTFKVMYQAIPTKQRMKVMTFKETIIEPTAMGASGIILLILTQVQQNTTLYIVYAFIIALSLLWIVLGKQLTKQYLKALEKFFSQRRMMSADLLEGIDKTILYNGLQSENEIEVIYCLDALEKVDKENFEVTLQSLLSHESKIVRQSVLTWIQKNELISLVDDIKNHITIEKDPDTLATTLELYAAFEKENSVEVIDFYLYHDNKTIVDGAVIALLKFTQIEGFKRASKVLNSLFDSEYKEDINQALNILKKVQTDNFYSSLEICFDSKDSEIKSLAIETTGNIKAQVFVPKLIENLYHNSFRNNALNALIHFNNTIYTQIIDAFTLSKNYSVKKALIKVLGAMKNDSADKFLLEMLIRGHFVTAILEILFKQGYTNENKNILKNILRNTITNILFDMRALEVIDKEKHKNSFQIINELKDKKFHAIFLALGFLYPKDTLTSLRLTFFSKNSEKKAYVVELLDNLLSNDIKTLVIPILDDISLQNKVAHFQNIVQVPNINEHSLLITEFLTNSSYAAILKSSLLYELSNNSQIEYIEHFQILSTHNDEMVSKTASWGYQQLQNHINSISDKRV
jgi:ATP:ADP antiporter, AAA family